MALRCRRRWRAASAIQLAFAKAADAVLLGAVGGRRDVDGARTAPRARFARYSQGARAVRQPAAPRSCTRNPPTPRRSNRRRRRPWTSAIVRELTGDIYFRPSARHRETRRRAGRIAARTWVHDQRVGNPPDWTAVAFQIARKAQSPAVLGRQDERARDHPTVARRDDRDRPRVSRMSSSPTCWSTMRRCSWCATPSSST